MLNDHLTRNLALSKSNFTKQLIKALYKIYGKKVSVVFFVNQFNLRAYGSAPIAYETGRKWLNGISIPQHSNMQILINWLNLDVNLIFEKTSSQETNKIDLTKLDDGPIIDGLNSHNLLNFISAIALELDPKHQSFLFFAALTLKEFSDKNDLNFNFESFINTLNLKINTTKMD